MAKYKEYGYDIQDGKAIIPEWETEIKEEAFEDCKELTSVEFPLWIKKIGKQAFNGCSNLTEITLPEWVEEIDYESSKVHADIDRLAVLLRPLSPKFADLLNNSKE